MQITKEQIKALDPCKEGYDWYLSNGTEDLLETLLKVNEKRPDWAMWLYTKLMSINQNQRLTIFAAEQVLHIFEDKYPEDKRPRLAIEAAKAVLLNDTEGNRQLAYDCADRVIASAASAYSDAYAYALAASAYGDDESAYVYGYAAASAGCAASAASVDIRSAYVLACNSMIKVEDKKKLQQLIIKEAVRILEEK